MAKYKQIKEIPSEKGDGDVTICNIRLLEDNESGDRVIQVRLKNNSAEAQVAFAVLRVECFDAQGNESEPNILERFGCDVGLGEYFGVKHPIRLKNKTTDNVFVSVDTVEFKYDESDNDPILAETECVPDEEEGENSVSEEADEAVYETGVEADESDNSIDEEQGTISNEAQDNSPAEQLPTAKETPAKVKNYSKYILAGTAAFVLICIGAGLSTSNRKTDIDKANVTVSETTEVSETTSQVRETEATTSKPVTTHSETTAVTQSEIASNSLPYSKELVDAPQGGSISVIDTDVTVKYEYVSEMYDYLYNGDWFCTAGMTYPKFTMINESDNDYAGVLNSICSDLKNSINFRNPDEFAAEVFDICFMSEDAAYCPNMGGRTHRLFVELVTQKFAVFYDSYSNREAGGQGYGSDAYYMYDIYRNYRIELDDLFTDGYNEVFAEEIIKQINQNPDEYFSNAVQSVPGYLNADNLSWYINENGGVTLTFPQEYLKPRMAGISEFDIPYSKIKDLLTPYGQTMINSLGISTDAQHDSSLKHGNTIGNIMNYSAYTTDGTNLYYAGGENGYDWRLSKSSDKNLTNAERINQDYTDWVLYYDGWIYYRTASDDNCLYKIKPDGSGKTKLTDSKTARINIDNGKLYFRQNGAFYEMNTDGSGKRVLVNDNCYGSFVTDGKLYYLSDDSCSVIQYDILTGEKNWYDPNYVGYKIKYFTVDSQRGLIYSIADSSTGESAFRCISLRGGGKADIHGDGFKAYSFNLDDENIYLACELNGKSVFAVIDISTFKVTAEYDYPVIQREFYIIGDMIYYFDKDGAVYKMAKPV